VRRIEGDGAPLATPLATPLAAPKRGAKRVANAGSRQRSAKAGGRMIVAKKTKTR
jgi:hypothetical protein